MAAVSGPLGERRQRARGDAIEGRVQAPADDPGRLTVTERNLAIIDLVLDASVPLPARLIGERLGLPKATVHRLLGTLEERALLMRDPATGGFTVGAGLSEMAFKILSRSAERGPAHMTLSALAAETGETCNLGVLDNGLARYVDRVEAGRSGLRLDLRPGSTVPLHASAMGKVLLAGMPEGLFRRHLAAASLAPLTPRTITDRGLLAAEIDRVRADGMAADDEEVIAGVNCLAVPVRHDGRVLAAVALQAPKARSDLDRLRGFLARLRDAAERLGSDMADGSPEAARRQPPSDRLRLSRSVGGAPAGPTSEETMR
jgi:DNA-binding IclR family transcriptional regulator